MKVPIACVNDNLINHSFNSPEGFPSSSRTITPPSIVSGKGSLSAIAFLEHQNAWPSLLNKTIGRLRTIGSASRSAYEKGGSLDAGISEQEDNPLTAVGQVPSGQLMWSHPPPSIHALVLFIKPGRALIYSRMRLTASILISADYCSR